MLEFGIAYQLFGRLPATRVLLRSAQFPYELAAGSSRVASFDPLHAIVSISEPDQSVWAFLIKGQGKLVW